MPIEHVGASHPMEVACPLPPQLTSLLAAHGPGILGGVLQLAPPGCTAHAAIAKAFNEARARRASSAAWLPLRSPRGARSTLVGATLGSASGSFVLFDGHVLFALTRNAQVTEIGNDLDALMHALQRGLHDAKTMPTWLHDALKTSPDVLGVSPNYDTRAANDSQAFRDAIVEANEANADAAFERFADARSTGRRIVEAQQILQTTPTNEVHAAWSKVIARMAARNPIAVQFAAEPEAEALPTFAQLEALGFEPGGALTEEAAGVLTGTYAFDVSALEGAFSRLGWFNELGLELEAQLRKLHAVDVFAWLASIRSGRVGGVVLRGGTPLPLDALPPLSTHWPLLVLALLTEQAFAWASPHCVTLLAQAERETKIPLREILLLLLERVPASFVNGANALAADTVHALGPAEVQEAEGWINRARARGKLPKRFSDLDPLDGGTFALLERSTALAVVRSFFVTDVARDPYTALAAARRTSSSSGREMLHAIYTGALPLRLKLNAAELAHARGDGRAQPLIASLQKSLEAEGRKLARM